MTREEMRSFSRAITRICAAIMAAVFALVLIVIGATVSLVAGPAWLVAAALVAASGISMAGVWIVWRIA